MSIKNEDLGSLLDGIDFNENGSPYQPSTPVTLDPLDIKAIERIIASDCKQVLNALYVDTPDTSDDCYTVFSCPSDPNPEKLYKVIALACAPFKPKKIERVGKGIYNILFASKSDADHAFLVPYTGGKMVNKGRPISFFYRISFHAEELRRDHEARIISAITEAIGVEAVSATITEEKKSATVYVSCIGDLATTLTDERADCIKVPQGGPFAPAYWLHIKRSTACSSNPMVIKLQVSNIPVSIPSEKSLLEAIKTVVAPIISLSNILGLSIYRFPDSGKNARFGFMYVLGTEVADLLEKVEIPIPGCKVPLSFQRAVERPYGESNESSNNNNQSGASSSDNRAPKRVRSWE